MSKECCEICLGQVGINKGFCLNYDCHCHRTNMSKEEINGFGEALDDFGNAMSEANKLENNTLTVEIPKGYKTLDIREKSEGDRHWIEIDLMKEEDMCKIHLPHYPCDKCDKAEKIQKGAKKFAKDFEGVMKDLSKE